MDSRLMVLLMVFFVGVSAGGHSEEVVPLGRFNEDDEVNLTMFKMTNDYTLCPPAEAPRKKCISIAVSLESIPSPQISTPDTLSKVLLGNFEIMV